MEKPTDPHVATLTDARNAIGSVLRQYRRGEHTALVFGERGKAEAVMLPYSVFAEIESLLAKQ